MLPKLRIKYVWKTKFLLTLLIPQGKLKQHYQGISMKKFLFSLLSLMLLAAILFLDSRIFSQASLTALYLIPVLLASVYVGLGAGMALTVLSAVFGTLWGQGLSADIRWDALSVWKLISALVIFGPAAYLSARLKASTVKQSSVAGIDPLTGLLNLNRFLELCQLEMHRACRSRKPLSLAYIDIDGLKKINDLSGFDKGDQLLKTFAEDIKNHTRASDLAARLGGDEFVILFPEAGVDQARGAAGKIRISFQEIAARLGCQATISMGLVTVFNPEVELERVMNKAFALLMEAKGQGGNNIKEGSLG